MAGERTMPGVGLRAYWTPGSNGWNDEHDPDTRTISILLQCSVLSRVASVPGSPTDGDMHILTDAPNQHAIAARENGAWVYLTPQEGWRAYDKATNSLLIFDGTAWTEFTSGAGALADLTDVDLTGLADGDIIVWDAVAGEWVPLGSAELMGPPGDDGPPGPSPVLSVASTSSNTINATGTKTFTYTDEPNLKLTLGMRVRAVKTSDPTQWIEGNLTAVSTTSLTIGSALAFAGSGTHTDWTIGLSGATPNANSRGSTSSHTVGTGSKAFSFTTPGSLHQWAVGSRLRVVYVPDPTIFMEGLVTASSGTSVTVNVDYAVGSGTYADWRVLLTGERGAAGTNGTNGTSVAASLSSTSSIEISSGNKAFTYTATGTVAFAVGQRMRAIYDANNWLEGRIVTITGSVITIAVDSALGTNNTWAVWTIVPATGQDTLTSVTSTDSETVSTGSKVIFHGIQPGKLPWVVGTRVRIQNSASIWMEGLVTAVTIFNVTVDVTLVSGSGSHSSWLVYVTGEPGAAGTSFPTFTSDEKTANYTAVNGDFAGNKIIRMNVGSANTFTVNSGITNVEPVSIVQMGTGQTTIVAGAGVTINSSNGLKIRARYGVATLIRIAADTYILSGDTAP